MSYAVSLKSDFERPPVAEWMSPPKACNLPVWQVPHATARKRLALAPTQPEAPDSSQHPQAPAGFHLDLDDGASACWTSPPRSRRRQSPSSSRRNQENEHFSVQVSPNVSITLHSPKSVTAYVTSKTNKKNKKFSLKIRSPRRRRGRPGTSSGSISGEDLASDVGPLLLSPASRGAADCTSPAELSREQQHDTRAFAGSTAELHRSRPVDHSQKHVEAMEASRSAQLAEVPAHDPAGGIVRKTAVMKEFRPPGTGAPRDSREQLSIRPAGALRDSREQLSSARSGRSARKTVKRAQLTEFKPPYSFSPPQKLSPEKNPENAKVASTSKPNDENNSPDRMTQQLKNLLDTLDEEKKRMDDEKKRRSGRSEPFILNNGAVDLGRRGGPHSSPRKRVIDVKAAQDYIREQKKKRQKMSQAEKAKKKIETEERQKKLAELRIRSLQLAAASKRSKPRTGTKNEEQVRVVDNEEDLTLSLGLRQVKPRRSYSESLASLGWPRNVALPSARLSQPAHPDSESLARSLNVIIPSTVAVPQSAHADRGGSGTKDAQDLVCVVDEDRGEVAARRAAYRQAEYEAQVRKLTDGLAVPQVEVRASPDMNATLMKLAQALQARIDAKERQSARYKQRIEPIPEVRKMARRIPEQEPVSETLNQPGPDSETSQETGQVLAVDAETIADLKVEIREIAQGFQQLQASMARRPADVPAKEKGRGREEKEDRIPDWLLTIQPRPHPYNVFTAIRNKLRAGQQRSGQQQRDERIQPESRGDSPYLSDFEPLSSSVPASSVPASPAPALLRRDHHHQIPVIRSDSGKGPRNLVPVRRDSGSDLSSSILDSEKFVSAESKVSDAPAPASGRFSDKSQSVSQSLSRTASAPKSTSIPPPESRSRVATPTSRSSSIPESISSSADGSTSTLSSYKANIVLMPPEARLNNALSPRAGSKPLNTDRPGPPSDSTVTQVIDNLSGGSERGEKELKKTNEMSSLKRPDPFQALLDSEFNVLDNLQRNLAQFVQAERLKALGVAKNEKAVNTERVKTTEDHSVQTSFAEPCVESEVESIHTQVEQDITVNKSIVDVTESEQESLGTEIESARVTDQLMSGLTRQDSEGAERGAEWQSESEGAEGGAEGISLQMLSRMMKDEELRAEHQLALIKLRQDALVEKTNAYIAMLDKQKRMLQQQGGREDGLISAIKKKKRGILLRYQSEREEIRRLKRMHQIASEDRTIMMKQQSHIHRMQLHNKGLKGHFTHGKDKIPNKPKARHDAEISEDIASNDSSVADSIETFIQHSQLSDLDAALPSEHAVKAPSQLSPDKLSKGHAVGPDKLSKSSLGKLKKDRDKLSACRALLGEKERKLAQEKHCVEEVLEWKRRLEQEEARLREMRRRALSLGKGDVGEWKDDGDKLSIPLDSSKPKVLAEVESERYSDSIPEALSGASGEEEIGEEMEEEVPGASTGRSTKDEYSSETFEASSEPQPPSRTQPAAVAAVSGHLKAPPMVKTALSPRHGRRRHSSGSDDSANLSHETTSEPSDVECRLKALKEQLKSRKMEAERLRREQKRKHRERLKQKEESLVKQIQAYDVYIEQLRRDVEHASKPVTPHASTTPPRVARPVIKTPRAERKKPVSDERGSIGEALPEEMGSDSIGEALPEERESQSINEALEEEGKEGSFTSISEEVYEVEDHAQDPLESELSRVSSGLEESQASFSDDVEAIESEKVSVLVTPKEDAVSELIDDMSSKTEKVVEKFEESQSESEGVDTASVKTAIASPGKTEASDVTSQVDTPSTKQESEGIATQLDTPDQATQLEEATQDSGSSLISSAPGEFSQKLTEASQSMKVSLAATESVESGQVSSAATESVESGKVSLAATGSIESGKVSSVVIKSIESAEISSAAIKQSEKEEELEKDSYADSFESISEVDEDSAKSASTEEQSVEEVVEAEPEESLDEPETEEDEGRGIDGGVERVVEGIMGELVGECVEEVAWMMGKQRARRVDDLTDLLAEKVLKEAMDQALAIYHTKVKRTEPEEEEPISPDRMTWDVRRRIHEIMASQVPQGRRQQRRVQAMLQTTYDVSPAHSPKHDERADGQTAHEHFISSLSPTSPRRSDSKQVQVAARDVGAGQARDGPVADADGQEWFDEDFGLTKTRREAERLRLQQLQIEQEIEQLEAQQEQVPYFYLREIPNKPPPPYTPPGRAPAPPDQPLPAPTSEAEISRRVRSFAHAQYRARRGTTPALCPPKDLEDPFTLFLWDLTAELVTETCEQGRELKEPVAPWERVPPPLASWRAAQQPAPTSAAAVEALTEQAVQRALVLLGLRRRVARESAIVQWSRKKRDHVDELLVWESQAEDAEWARFDPELVQVKNELCVTVLDRLVHDTAACMDRVLEKKRAKLASQASGLAREASEAVARL